MRYLPAARQCGRCVYHARMILAVQPSNINIMGTAGGHRGARKCGTGVPVTGEHATRARALWLGRCTSPIRMRRAPSSKSLLCSVLVESSKQRCELSDSCVEETRSPCQLSTRAPQDPIAYNGDAVIMKTGRERSTSSSRYRGGTSKLRFNINLWHPYVLGATCRSCQAHTHLGIPRSNLGAPSRMQIK